MKYLSVCAGIEAASVAWHPLGWVPAAFSQHEPEHDYRRGPDFASAVLAERWPGVPNLGDMTEWQEWGDGPDGALRGLDLLVGGTPCQSFSVAGLRKGLADPRGNLALTYLAIADRYRPRWLVWENVPGVLSSGGGRDFGALVGAMVELGYGCAWRVLDAQYVRVDGFARAVPQRRRRVFLVGYLGDWRRAAAVLFERESLQGHPPPRREAREGVAAPLIVRSGGGSGPGTTADDAENLIAYGGNNTSGASEDGTGRGVPIVAFDARQADVVVYGDRAGPLDTDAFSQAVAFAQNSRDEVRLEGGDGATAASLKAGGGKPGQSYPAIADGWGIRRLTPVECERLQGFPDGWTAIEWYPASRRKLAADYLKYLMRDGRLSREQCYRLAADGPRYRALGNSMAVNVMRWLGRRIELVEEIGREIRAEAARRGAA